LTSGRCSTSGQIDVAFRDQRAQRIERMAGQVGKGFGIEPGRAVDLRGFAVAFPDQIGLHADDRIASPHFAAGHRFKHEAVCAGLGQLEHQ
jgi:hypothetical protein